MENALKTFVLESVNISLFYAIFVAFLASFLKYIIPPFPGDLTLILITFYATNSKESLFAIFLSIFFGGFLGSCLAYEIGSSEKVSSLLFGDRVKENFLKTERIFHRFSFFMMAFNRFLLGIRPFIFPMAGFFKVKRHIVILASIVSNITFALFLCGIVFTSKKYFFEAKGVYHIIALWIEFIILSIIISLLMFAFRKKIFNFIR